MQFILYSGICYVFSILCGVPAVFAVKGAGLGGQVATPALVLPQPAAVLASVVRLTGVGLARVPKYIHFCS